MLYTQNLCYKSLLSQLKQNKTKHKQPKNEGEKGYPCRPSKKKKKIKKACPLFWTFPEFMHLVLSSPPFTLMTPITPLCITSKSL